MKGYGFLSFAGKTGDQHGKELMYTATKTGVNAVKKFGDEYGKNLIGNAKKRGTNFAKTTGKKKKLKNLQKQLEI